MNQFNTIKIYVISEDSRILTQGSNSLLLSLLHCRLFTQLFTLYHCRYFTAPRLQTRRHWNISMDIKQGENFHGLKVLKSYSPFFYHCRIMLEINIKRRKRKLLSHVRLCNPRDYTVHEILQARILEWAAVPFSRGPSQLRDQTEVFHIAGRFFTSWVTSR